MTDDLNAPASGGPAPNAFGRGPAAAPTAPSATAAASSAVQPTILLPSWMPRAAVVGGILLTVICVVSAALAWQANQRGASLEQELVRRQQDSAVGVTEARAVARQAQESVSADAAKVALLEARVAEVTVQRSQLEDLIQSLSRSRDETLLIDVEAAIRVGLQQTNVTGSAEPLVAALKQADERLANYDQPRLEGVRRAIKRDLDRLRATGVADVASLGSKLDEAMRLIDELPLLVVATAAPGSGSEPAADAAVRAAPPASASSSSPVARWLSELRSVWADVSEQVWSEARSLVRVTRIDHPEAMLLAPDQSFFLRENLKLRLLNARLALLSRQFDTAQADLQAAQTALDRYFDRNSRRTQLAIELLRQVSGQARQVVVSRPDDTLAALAAASAGR